LVKGKTSRSKLTGNDVILGSQGKDQLSGLTGNDQIFGKAGRDRLKGNSDNDRVYGGSGHDKVIGGGGNDWLKGGTGKDMILGGGGADVLVGGDGVDQLTGGSGIDLFVFATLTQQGDKVTDFNAQADLLDLRQIFAAAQFSGTTPAEQFQQFIQVEQVGANTVIRVDADGSSLGSVFSSLVTLNNASGIGSQNFVIS
jgi:Ca2+-binding RTX toxin-like protein